MRNAPDNLNEAIRLASSEELIVQVLENDETQRTRKETMPQVINELNQWSICQSIE